MSIERKRNAVREEWKNLTRHTMQGNVRLERERMEKGMALGNRIDDLEREIVKKRFQMDMLKHPEKASVYESRAMARIHEAQRTAESNRRDRQSEIDRQIKPEKSVADVVSEYEAKTVGRLRGVLTARVLEDERTVEGMRKKLLQLRDAALSIPVLSREELVALKRKLMAE